MSGTSQAAAVVSCMAALMLQAHHIATVADAVANITEQLKSQGFEITLMVDYAAAAASVGLMFPPTQLVFARPPRILIVFGNPNAGTRLMQVDRRIAIDLPQKFLV